MSRPFQHRTISDKAYVVAIVAIWMIAGGIPIVSFLASTDRFVVFFYIVLPLLTISQLLMIMSYVSIWIIVTSRPQGRRLRRRQKAQLIFQSESVTKTTRSTSRDQETGSVKFSVSDKEDSSLLSDHETPSTRGCLRSTSDDRGSVRDAGEPFHNKTSPIRDYELGTRTVRDDMVLHDNKNPIRDNVGSTRDDTGSVRDLWVLFDNKTNPIRDYRGSTGDDTSILENIGHTIADDTGSVHNLQNGPFENRLTSEAHDKESTTRWKSRLLSRKIITSINSFHSFEQKNYDFGEMKTDPKCNAGCLSSDANGVFNRCTSMMSNSASRKQKIPRPQRTSSCVEPYDRDHRLAMTLFIATAISLLAWLPFEVMNIIMSLCVSCRVQLYNIHVLSFTKFLHYANSFVNPIIYTFRIQEFRRAINKILKFPMAKRRGVGGGRRSSLELSMLSTWRNKTCEIKES